MWNCFFFLFCSLSLFRLLYSFNSSTHKLKSTSLDIFCFVFVLVLLALYFEFLFRFFLLLLHRFGLFVNIHIYFFWYCYFFTIVVMDRIRCTMCISSKAILNVYIYNCIMLLFARFECSHCNSVVKWLQQRGRRKSRRLYQQMAAVAVEEEAAPVEVPTTRWTRAMRSRKNNSHVRRWPLDCTSCKRHK